MYSKNCTSLTLGILLLSTSFTLIGSEQEAQFFFESAKNGLYKNMIDQAKKGLITTDDLLNSKDANGNTLLLAAIQGYPLAVKKYGEEDAAGNLNKIVNLLLPKLSKEQVSADMINTQNNDGMTVLALLAKVGVNKANIYGALRSKGALAISADKKKASDSATSKNKKQIIDMLRSWETYEEANVDWSPMGQAFGSFGEKFEDFGTKVKEAFTGSDK